MMPGMPDLSQLLLQAQQMQAEMERAQASLAEAQVTGSAGNGLVTAVVTGGGDLLRLRIDPSVVDPAEVETLEDLVIAAVHDARRQAEQLASSAMGSVAGGLDLASLGLPGLPGMGLPGFGGGADDELEDDEYPEDDDDDDSDDEDDDSVYADAEAFDEETDAEHRFVVEQARQRGELPPAGTPETGGA